MAFMSYPFVCLTWYSPRGASTRASLSSCKHSVCFFFFLWFRICNAKHPNNDGLAMFLLPGVIKSNVSGSRLVSPVWYVRKPYLSLIFTASTFFGFDTCVASFSKGLCWYGVSSYTRPGLYPRLIAQDTDRGEHIGCVSCVLRRLRSEVCDIFHEYLIV